MVGTLLETVEKSSQAQVSNFQVRSNATLSYADIACQRLDGLPRNRWAPPSPKTTPLTTIDTVYCTVETSRIEEVDKHKTQTGELGNRSRRKYVSWKAVRIGGASMAAVDDVRREHIRVTCRDDVEL